MNAALDPLARSRDRILDLLLKAEEPLSVQALGAALGISRNAAHQQVIALEHEGLIERASAIRTRGRPSQAYRLSATGMAAFPRQYSILAKQLLAELSQILTPDQLRSAMDRMGENLAQTLESRVTGSPDRVAAIAGLMRELGYESQALDGADGTEIEAHNCVFHDLAMADSNICGIDLALLRKLSGQDVEHRRCMARGERSCRFAFKSAAEDAKTVD
jgi:DeoR family transcriptional regulator, suf operon transcriptional repressor